jgi:3',5'-cyclic AMP phosphodiesterase CpdA
VFRLAHVTDPHFRGFAGARPTDFLNKRAVGALNLLVNRRRKHRMELLEALREDLRDRGVDHLALTGDLANVSLEAEWEAAARWIEATGAPSEAVTVIPGNHDTYVEEVVRSAAFERIFARYQTAELRQGQEVYPFVRLRGEVALVAVSTCVATGDLGAWGEIGAAQLGRLEALLTAPEVAARVRVVLLHHPPVMHRPPEDRNLRDREQLVALLARTGADLVLHGHDHRDEQVLLRGPEGAAIPVIGAGSASYAGSPERRSRYNVYEIDGPRLTLLTYAHDEARDAYCEVRRAPLAG